MPAARVVLYASSVGVVLLTARALLIGPPSVPVAVAVLLGYCAIVLAGVMHIGLRMFADAIVRGPLLARGVALTFDDGPDPSTTPKVLDALHAAGAKATFFVIGKKAEDHPDLVRDIVRRGHEVGLHSYEHDRWMALRSEDRVTADLARGMRVLEDITGERPLFFRPPIGHTNPIIARAADALDLVVVGWSASGWDGTAGAIPRAVVNRLRRSLEDGAILALHDAAEHGGRTPAGVIALPEVLEAASAKQIPVVTLGTWLHDPAFSAAA